MRLSALALILLATCSAISTNALAQAQNPNTILNISYDVSRELYKDINPVFAAE